LLPTAWHINKNELSLSEISINTNRNLVETRICPCDINIFSECDSPLCIKVSAREDFLTLL
jgi:hypothetical protein